MIPMHRFCLLPLLALATLANAQLPADPKAAANKPNVFASAKESATTDLKEAEMELGKLRTVIAAEKAQKNEELTTREQELSKLQEEAEPLGKQIDQAELEIANLKKQIDTRSGEDVYLTGVLNEFVQGYEPKLHQAELPTYKEKINLAKAAMENSGSSTQEKFTAQLAVVEASVARLQDMIGGSRFQGQAVDDKGNILKGAFAMLGPICMFATSDGATAGLAMPQAGSENPIIRQTTPELDAGAAQVANTGSGKAPVDASLGSAIKEFLEKESLIHTFEKGGPIMWPILVVAIMVFTVIVNRIVFVIRERSRRKPKDVTDLLLAAEKGDFVTAIAIGHKTKDFVARALGYALDHVETSISDALSLAANLELKRYKWGFFVLETGVAAAPLFGLLGTVTGMMNSFKSIGGDLGSPSAITGGIAEALIATAFGIGIAVLGMWPFNYLNTILEGAEHDLEVAASRLELIVQKNHQDQALRERNLKESLQGSPQPSPFTTGQTLPDPA